MRLALAAVSLTALPAAAFAEPVTLSQVFADAALFPQVIMASL